MDRTSRPFARTALGALLLVAVGAASCTQPRGRIMGDAEDDYVGARTAGGATYDRLIEEAMGKLLAREAAARSGLGKLRVAFLGVENRSREAIGDWHEEIAQIIGTAINTSQQFTQVSERYVAAGLKEAHLRRDDLFLPKHQREFARVLEQSGRPVECLLFATLTSGTTRGTGVEQVSHTLTLELVDLASGEPIQETARLRKAYTK